jgi:uncharacterized repeat protein (TIGR02543 family)
MNGGTPAETAKNNVLWTDASLVPADDPGKIGYTFKRWEVTSGGSGTVTPATTFGEVSSSETENHSITISAIFEINSYPVVYHGNGNTSGTAPVVGDQVFDSSYNVLSTYGDLKKTGSAFGGWATTPGGTAVPAIMIGVADNDLYAVWTLRTDYSVSYNAHAGSPTPDTVNGVTWTSTGFDADVPVRNGYVFGGWFTQESGSGIKVTSNTTPYSTLAGLDDGITSIVLHAMWTPRTGYSVSYDTHGAGSTTPDTVNGVTWETTGFVVADPTKNGYDFDGWYTAANGGGVRLGNNLTSYGTLAVNDTVGSVTLHAKWLPKTGYSVSYDTHGASTSTPSARPGLNWDSNNFDAGTPVKNGYDFGGWYTEENGGGNKVNSSATSYGSLAVDEAVKSITLHAKWTPMTGYSVSYNAQGGAPTPDDRNDVDWESAGFNAAAPVKNGYDFGGWFTGAGGTGIQVINDAIPYSSLALDDTVASIILYAKWTPMTGYSVLYDTHQADTETPVTKNATWETAGFVAPDPVKNGYDFGGWYTQENGDGTKVDNNATTYGAIAGSDTTTSITLHAKWTPMTGYSVSYDTHGASTDTPAARNSIN